MFTHPLQALRVPGIRNRLSRPRWTVTPEATEPALPDTREINEVLDTIATAIADRTLEKLEVRRWNRARNAVALAAAQRLFTGPG